MKKHILLKTNLFIGVIIIIGFLLTAVLSYRANYNVSLENIEKVSSLTSEGIYYQLTTIFTKPVNVSLTMANDSFLKAYLAKEGEQGDTQEYVEALKEYLKAYQKKYSYDSVFLISTDSGRYYNFNGVDRVMVKGDPENVWYYAMLEGGEDYSLNVDNDQVDNANNEITVFVNCKIKDADGSVIGIVGVGVRVNHLQSLLKEYEEKFGVDAFLVDQKGIIEISTGLTGYERVDMFEQNGLTQIRDTVLKWGKAETAQSMWVQKEGRQEEMDFIVTRYIPELNWHLIVERDTGETLRQFKQQLYQIAAIIALIIVIILLAITYVIKGYNRQIFKLAKEQAEIFRKSTEKMYDNIYELNITRNCPAGKSTEQYFASMGVPKFANYDEALEIIAHKQIKEEFRKGYIDRFCTKNVLQEYKRGNMHLSYDFMISEDGKNYFWMRIDANIYYSEEDHTVRMFTYRKNIDAQKQKERQIKELAQTDEMTGVYNKTSTERRIEAILAQKETVQYAFFIMDIDNFKQANDRHGHAFGDHVICRFVSILKEQFRKEDLLGRVGGDEFAAFIRVPDRDFVERKAAALVRALDTVCTEAGPEGEKSWKMTASVGVALSPQDGTSFEALYKHADEALYEKKRKGKNGYRIYR